jgi:hypothetical protein
MQIAFMALYDVLRNADRVSLDDIVQRQKILSKGYDASHPPDGDDWKAPYAADRAKFVRAFYNYVRILTGDRSFRASG